MTVRELIEKLSALGRPDAEVATEYPLHDYCRTVHAYVVTGVAPTPVYVDGKRLVIPQDEEQTIRNEERSEWREVVIIH